MIALGVLVMTTFSEAAGVRFPADPCTAPSPDGHYEVACQERQVTDFGSVEYKLVIWDIEARIGRVVLTWSRGVDVLWAPDSRHVAVTYWAGSSDAIVLVYSPSGRVVLELNPALERPFGQLPVLYDPPHALHMYFEALQWLRNDTLLIKFWGDRRTTQRSVISLSALPPPSAARQGGFRSARDPWGMIPAPLHTPISEGTP
jgi:hypothetical protein